MSAGWYCVGMSAELDRVSRDKIGQNSKDRMGMGRHVGSMGLSRHVGRMGQGRHVGRMGQGRQIHYGTE